MWVLCAVAFAHQFGPQAPTGTEFSNFFKEVIMYIEEERETRREFINLQTTLESSIDVCKTISYSESEFLDGGCPCLANMITTYANGIPARHVTRTKFDCVRHQAHGWLWWKEEFFLCAVFLEDIVLQRATQLFHGKATLLGVDDIHGPDDGSRAIDSHRGRNFVEG